MEAVLENYLHDNIPLSRAMGIRVLIASPARILLECPLEPNINHHGTAFGGSIAACATLAGWCWLHVFMQERQLPAKLVISGSSMDYLMPISGGFTAELRPPSLETILAFTQTYARRGSARIELEVDILCKGEIAAQFKGTYAALAS